MVLKTQYIQMYTQNYVTYMKYLNKVSTLEATYHHCHHLLRHHPLPKRKKKLNLTILKLEYKITHMSLKVHGHVTSLMPHLAGTCATFPWQKAHFYQCCTTKTTVIRMANQNKGKYPQEQMKTRKKQGNDLKCRKMLATKLQLVFHLIG